ncbi:hypothetical protein JCM30237_03380 [Halolamina litorea]|uniref:DUF7282 domain-containing protein n=1 Tax=Halolamina litorea TaxID=1515593 RepID=A0ABD6BSE5_9EURY|nr:hypothetical protein [Halolamina litorea]
MAETQAESEGSPKLLRRTVIKLTAAGVATAATGASATGSVAAQESGEAEIVIPAQETYGFEINIETATMPDGGFISLIDPVNPHERVWPEVGETMPSEQAAIDNMTLGTTEFLEPGTHENVTITLDEPLDFDHHTAEEMEGKLYQVWMHRDTDGNGEFTNLSPGEADNRYGYQNENQHPTEADEVVMGEAYLQQADFNPGTVEAQITQNEEQISSLQSEIEELRGSSEDQSERISELEGQVETLRSEVDDLNSAANATEEPEPTETSGPGFGIMTTIAGAAVGAAAAAKRFGGSSDDEE